MGIGSVAGRHFTGRDVADSPNVVIVNQALARRYWPDEDPIGRRVAFNQVDGRPNWREIVGVVADVRGLSLDLDPKPEIYIPFTQFPSPFMTIVVRTTNDPLGYVAAARNEVLAVDQSQPISNIHTME